MKIVKIKLCKNYIKLILQLNSPNELNKIFKLYINDKHNKYIEISVNKINSETTKFTPNLTYLSYNATFRIKENMLIKDINENVKDKIIHDLNKINIDKFNVTAFNYNNAHINFDTIEIEKLKDKGKVHLISCGDTTSPYTETIRYYTLIEKREETK